MGSIGLCGSDGLVHLTHKGIWLWLALCSMYPDAIEICGGSQSLSAEPFLASKPVLGMTQVALEAQCFLCHKSTAFPLPKQ